jgi:hypothetical protein
MRLLTLKNMILKSGKKTIAHTNTSEVLGANVPLASICVQAKLNNSNSIFIGGQDDQKIELEAGDSIELDIVDNLNKIYVKGTAGEGVNYIYETN